MKQSEIERLSQQCEDLLEYFKSHSSITHREAENELGIMRLSARIWDLKQRNHVFEDKWVEFTARNGRKSRFKSYKKVK